MTGAGRRLVRTARSLTFAAIAAAWITGASNAHATEADAYPDRPIRLIITFPGMDSVGRLLGGKLAEVLGQPVVVDYHPGASGNIGNEAAAKAPPDGYTLVMGAMAMTILPNTHGTIAVDPVSAFAPISKVTSQPIVLSVHPALPVNSLADLIALAHKQPGKLAYSTGGVGTPPHLAAVMLAQRADIQLIHIPYANVNQSIRDNISGEIPISSTLLGFAEPYLRNHQLRGLAVTSLRRSPAFPELPTIAELGYPGFEVTSWYGILAPAGTPRGIIDQLHRELARILQMPDVRDKLAAMGMDVVGNTPEQFAAEIKADTARWAPLVRGAGISAQ